MSLLRAPGGRVFAYDELAEGIGYGSLPPAVSGYPGIGQLAKDLGLK